MRATTSVAYAGSDEFITAGTPEHAQTISPSKVAAICGVSRFESPYSLWCRMKGWTEPIPPNDIFAVGHAFEPALAALWKIENPGWKLSKGEVQYVTDKLGFPAVATLDRRAVRGSKRRIVEFKTARDLSLWGDPDLDGDCPADYALQVIAQQVITGLAEPAHLMVMGPFFKWRTYTVSYDIEVASWMLEKCRAFYASLQADEPPPLDSHVATYASVREQHPDIEEGLSAEIPAELARAWREQSRVVEDANTTLRGVKVRVLSNVRNAQYVTCDGQTVGSRRPHRSGSVMLVLR